MVLKGKKGFTLIEVIVVIAVVAILAAILAPNIAKNIDDSKKARALNETVVIGAAIGDFYKDAGVWPQYSNSANPADIYLLTSGTGGTGTAGGGSSGWWQRDAGWGGGNKDSLEDQLITNDPGYATTVPSQYQWKGPYIPEVNADPWNTHYSVNIAYVSTPNINPEDSGNFACWVLSAGPNKIWETSVDQGNLPGQGGSSAGPPPTINNLNAATGDDIGTQIK